MKERVGNKKKHKCVGNCVQVIVNLGTYEICRKCNPMTGCCSDNGEECPYLAHGIKWIPCRDTGLPEWMKNRASKGGKKAHGLNTA